MRSAPAAGGGFYRLAGGSWRDSGERLGASRAGDLVDATVDAALPRTVTHNFAVARQALRVWRHMPEFWRRHVNGVTVREQRVSREVVVLWNAACERMGEDLKVASASFKLSRQAFQRGESYALSSPTDARVERRPLSEPEREDVEKTVARISDDRLRKSVQDAMTAMLEWKKSKES